MKISDYLSWFDSIMDRFQAIPRRAWNEYDPPKHTFDHIESQSWVSKAGSALSSVFPAGHYLIQTWDRLLPKLRPDVVHGGSLEELFGVFSSSARMLREGRVGTIIDTIRTETEDGLLDQSLVLANANHLAAAAVISGGAPESHLNHLVTKNNLTITGEGSISKYDGAIAQARNNGTIEVYSATDSKQVGAWGGMRNDAAHDPKTFNRTRAEVRLMIDGIRNFIARVN
ncbi:MAG: hypothetical protein ACLQU5_23650 [Isosphaeraceae bacterium]